MRPNGQLLAFNFATHALLQNIAAVPSSSALSISGSVDFLEHNHRQKKRRTAALHLAGQRRSKSMQPFELD